MPARKGLPDLDKGLYEAKGQIGFIGYQTPFFVKLVELYNPTDEPYAWEGLRHPAAGPYVKKTTPRRLEEDEITPKLLRQCKKRAKQAAPFLDGSRARTVTIPRSVMAAAADEFDPSDLTTQTVLFIGDPFHTWPVMAAWLDLWPCDARTLVCQDSEALMRAFFASHVPVHRQHVCDSFSEFDKLRHDGRVAVVASDAMRECAVRFRHKTREALLLLYHPSLVNLPREFRTSMDIVVLVPPLADGEVTKFHQDYCTKAWSEVQAAYNHARDSGHQLVTDFRTNAMRVYHLGPAAVEEEKDN